MQDSTIMAKGEMHAVGDRLSQDIILVIAAHDDLGRVVGVNSNLFDSTSFYSFEPFSLEVRVFSLQISKVLLYVKPKPERVIRGRKR